MIDRLPLRRLRRICIFLLLPLALSLLAAVPAHAAKPQPRAAARAAQSAEQRLIEVYRLIGSGELRAALAKADALVADWPNFKLAHLARGDILMALGRPLREFGDVGAAGLPTAAAPAASAAASATAAVPGGRTNGNPNLVLQPPSLAELREEAMQRIRALRERPGPDQIPAAFVDLAPLTRDALLVDLSRSRLYHYQQRDGKVTLAADYYITQGRLGAHKEREGDYKTPLGIYYLTSNIDRRRLDAFYGAGALTINFPNEYDKRRNRSGSGIWLHGVPGGPSGTYARVPRASDGCVVMANPDLQKIIATIKPGETPIVIVEKATWLDRGAWQKQRDAFLELFNAWVRDRARPDNGALRRFYSPSFNSYGQPLDAWYAKNYATPVTAPPQHTTLLYDPAEQLLVATFYDVGQRGHRPALTRKRQYWSKAGGQWQIFFEGALGL